ncbi:MAG: glycoside hydrolase family 5 protein, partial [Myxococcota bacterium]
MKKEFSVRDGRIVDRHGRVRIFHGANVSGRAKTPPFLPLEDPGDLDALARWGWNLVRLVTLWEAIEPEPGRYDDAYLDALVRFVHACRARGLSVIIDLHQDLYSRHYGGDGAPAWTLPENPGGPSFGGARGYYNYFLCRDMIHAEQRFWRNADGIQDHYLAMLTHLGGRFSGIPGVLGYDLMNEPMGHPVQVFLGAFERKTLAGFYRRAIAAVREGDPDRLVFIEPAPLAGRGYPCFLPVFDAPGIVFTPHLYDSIAMRTMRYGSPLRTGPYAIHRFEATASRLGTPVLIGEFGILTGTPESRRLLASQAENFDGRFFSW